MCIWNKYVSSRHLGFWSRITPLESLGILNTDCVTSDFEHGLRHLEFWSRDKRLKPLHIQHLQHSIDNSRFYYLPTLKFILTNNKSSDHAQNHILVRFCIIAVIYHIKFTSQYISSNKKNRRRVCLTVYDITLGGCQIYNVSIISESNIYNQVSSWANKQTMSTRHIVCL